MASPLRPVLRASESVRRPHRFRSRQVSADRRSDRPPAFDIGSPACRPDRTQRAVIRTDLRRQSPATKAPCTHLFGPRFPTRWRQQRSDGKIVTLSDRFPGIVHEPQRNLVVSADRGRRFPVQFNQQHRGSPDQRCLHHSGPTRAPGIRADRFGSDRPPRAGPGAHSFAANTERNR